MSVMEDPGSGDWVLKIKSSKHSDSGNYECQINTVPVTKHTISLTVVGNYQLCLLPPSHWPLINVMC